MAVMSKKNKKIGAYMDSRPDIDWASSESNKILYQEFPQHSKNRAGKSRLRSFKINKIKKESAAVEIPKIKTTGNGQPVKYGLTIDENLFIQFKITLAINRQKGSVVLREAIEDYVAKNKNRL